MFQPHTFSRTAELFDDFVRVFAECEADRIILCDIYPARETNIYGVSSADMAEKISATGKSCLTADSFAHAAELADSCSAKDDVIIVMGAGDVIAVADILEAEYAKLI